MSEIYIYIIVCRSMFQDSALYSAASCVDLVSGFVYFITACDNLVIFTGFMDLAFVKQRQLKIKR